jgi:L-seryl-tRNA(Ser) seleniumtransferase
VRLARREALEPKWYPAATGPASMPQFRVIPSIEQLRQRPAMQRLAGRYGTAALVDALRTATAHLRERLTVSPPPADVPNSAGQAVAAIERAVEAHLESGFRPSLTRVINATGVVLHTNLGRAPLGAAALGRIAEIGSGYTNLEYDLAAGRRGARDTHAEALLCRLSGAAAAVVVNNCAAATLLVLAALARGREVLVSRGELIEIGGGFRVPDVMAQSGARLREVGTTNRTRAADYALAIGDRTAAMLRVHPSNFSIDGFTERPALEELVALARRFSVPLIEDLGSGMVVEGLVADEPLVQDSIAAGVDVVCFSGDKLLGGPQAGIILGRTDLLAQVRRHPLLRALRVDKLTYAALEATLIEHLAGRATSTVPALRMASTPIETIAGRAEQMARALANAGLRAELVDGASTLGGGTAPSSALPTRLLALSVASLSPDALEARLRALDPPVVARIDHDRVVLDLRTVLPDDDELLVHVLTRLAE